MSKAKDCRILEGDQTVIISRSTAIAALDAMDQAKGIGAYKMLRGDAANLIRACMRELQLARNL